MWDGSSGKLDSPLLGASWIIKRAGRLNVGGLKVGREREETGRRS